MTSSRQAPPAAANVAFTAVSAAALSDEIVRLFAALRAAAERLVAVSFADAADKRSAALAVCERSAEIAELAIDSLTALHPPPQPLACARGCHACCRIDDLATDAPTVISVAHHAFALFDADAYALLRLRAQAGRRDGCLLLEANGDCALHPVRPLVCRTFNAFDAAACARGEFPKAGDGRGDAWRPSVGAALQEGIAAGLAALGLDARLLRFNLALKLVLTDPRAADRWLAGEPAFDAAAISRADPPIDGDAKSCS